MNKLPFDFAHCQTHTCPKKNKCLRYLAVENLPSDAYRVAYRWGDPDENYSCFLKAYPKRNTES